MSRLIVISLVVALSNTAAAITPNFNAKTGVLGIVSGVNGPYMLCANGDIYYGRSPSMHDGVETPGSWGGALGRVPVPVEDIIDFWGPGFQTRDGMIWVWASAYETYCWTGPGGDRICEQREVGQYWSSYPASPCSASPVVNTLKTLGGVKSLFR